MRHPARPVCVALATTCSLAFGPGPTQAQVADPVRTALEQLRRDNAWTLSQQVELCRIPAPPFGEAARGRDLARRFAALGLKGLRTDGAGNVIAERPGTSATAPRVALTAHLDTVFPDTAVTVTRDGSRLHGPGIGDDCRGLAVILAVARAMQENRVPTDGTVIFVGTVGEEGPGNLRGVRHLFTAGSAGRIDYFVSVDGAGTGTTSAAVGSYRYLVTVRGPGGHSYGAFGMANPIHALGRAVAAIADLAVPSDPKTTFNVGIIEGGTSVNSIAMRASMQVDLRSASPEALDRLDAGFRTALDGAVAAEHRRWPSSPHLEMDIERTGTRPAGVQPDTAYIVRTAVRTARAVGVTTTLETSSTDANHPMSLGIPAVTIDGGGSGYGSHSLGEWYDDGEDGWRGPQWALRLAIDLARQRRP